MPWGGLYIQILTERGVAPDFRTHEGFAVLISIKSVILTLPVSLDVIYCKLPPSTRLS